MRVVKPFVPSGERTLRISLCDTNPEVVDAWLDTFSDVEGVEVLLGDLLDAGCDAIVSPANSFGDMSGGVDKRIDDHFRGATQSAVVQAIRDRYFGELPVGVALVVQMADCRLPLIVASPTMRVPQSVGSTIYAYLAFRGALVSVLQHNLISSPRIGSLAVPGLCTGVGGMPYGQAARQMRSAYDNVVGGRWMEVVHPAMAPFTLGSDWGHRGAL
jgi:O-acetyl-ADP-ribose deacetylase (regulator of RNase III)